MTAQPLSYAEVSRPDPLPALRRLRTLSLVWSIAVLLNSTVFITGLLLWPGRGYQPGEYYPSYFERPYWFFDLIQPTTAVLVLIAACAWVEPLDRRRIPVVALAVVAAASFLVAPAWFLAMTSPGSAAGPHVVIVTIAQAATIAAMPATLAMAACSPSRFSASRLAYAAGVAMFLLCAMFAPNMIAFTKSLKSLITAGSDFWPYLVSWWYPFLIFLGALTAAALFLVGAIRLRHGGSDKAARLASFIVLASILVWPTVGILMSFNTFYWLDAPSHISWCLMTQCLGLAFLRPPGREDVN